MTKHYDPQAVEALVESVKTLGIAWDRAASWGLHTAPGSGSIGAEIEATQHSAAAVRASAREAGEVSEEEIDKWLREQGWTLIQPEDYEFVRAALARFAPPRGRVVEGWALVESEPGSYPTIYPLRADAEHYATDGQEVVPCLITILAAPPRGEEG